MIIDKYNDPTDFEEMKYRQNLDLTNIDDIKELFDRLEDKRIPDRIGSDIPKRFTNSMNKNSNAINKYISLHDDVKLIDDAKLCLLARETIVATSITKADGLILETKTTVLNS